MKSSTTVNLGLNTTKWICLLTSNQQFVAINELPTDVKKNFQYGFLKKYLSSLRFILEGLTTLLSLRAHCPDLSMSVAR